MIATRMTNNQFHIISVFYQEMSKSIVCPSNELLDFDSNRFIVFYKCITDEIILLKLFTKISNNELRQHYVVFTD